MIHAGVGKTLAVELSRNDVSGEVRVDHLATFQALRDFSNGGLVVLNGDSAVVTGSAVGNTGTITGRGRIANTVVNAGTVLADQGRLTLAGANNGNLAAGNLEAGPNAELFYSQGLNENFGTIVLRSGTFDSNNFPITNSGSIKGDGVWRSGLVTNEGDINVGMGTLNVLADVVNNGSISVGENDAAVFFGDFSGAGASGSGLVRFLGQVSPGNSLKSIAPAPFYDTNGDDFLSPLDALVVINFVNSQPAGGEGEHTTDIERISVDVGQLGRAELLGIGDALLMRHAESSEPSSQQGFMWGAADDIGSEAESEWTGRCEIAACFEVTD